MHPARLFKRRDRRHLWDDSSDDDDDENIEVIDLSRSPELTIASGASNHVVSTRSNDQRWLLPAQPMSPAVAVTTTTSSVRQPATAPYVPCTLRENSRRYSILPAFPASFGDNYPPLLLTNVPGMLSRQCMDQSKETLLCCLF